MSVTVPTLVLVLPMFVALMLPWFWLSRKAAETLLCQLEKRHAREWGAMNAYFDRCGFGARLEQQMIDYPRVAELLSNPVMLAEYDRAYLEGRQEAW